MYVTETCNTKCNWKDVQRTKEKENHYIYTKEGIKEYKDFNQQQKKPQTMKSSLQVPEAAT